MPNFFDLESSWLTNNNKVTLPPNTANLDLTDQDFSNALQSQMLKNEQTRLNQKQQSIDLAKTSQNRMLTLNNSFSARYGAYNKIIIVLVVCFLIFIGLMFIHGAIPAIPSGIMDLAYILILSVGFIYCVIIYLDIQSRDPVYFDQLNLPAPVVPGNAGNTASDLNKAANSGNLLGSITLDTCIGSVCCDNGTTTWDTGTSTCIRKESFATVLDSINALNPVVSGVKPFRLSEGDLYSRV